MSPDYFLASGNHDSRSQGMCSMEWVAYIAGEEHSDAPVCVCPALRRFGIGLNDSLPDDLRQRPQRGRDAVELAATVVGDHERLGPFVDGATRVVARQHARMQASRPRPVRQAS